MYYLHFLKIFLVTVTTNTNENQFFFEREISLIEGQTASTIGIKVKQDTIKQD